MYLLNIELKKNEAKYISLYKHIKKLIISGTLKPNEKLPSRRVLSEELHISTNTVLNSYFLLYDEGYIYSKEKSGYYISPYYNYQNNEEKKEEESKKDNDDKYNFTSESIDKSLFPFYTVKKLTQDIIISNEDILLSKSPFQGDISLRKAIASYLFEHKGMNVTSQNIVIVSSLEESLEIISSILPINKIALENPLYKKVYDFFNRRKVNISLCPIDKEGIVIDKTKPYDLVYVTPYNQFPLGIKMSNTRRQEILSSHSSFIFEDDFDCDLISRNKFMSTLYSQNNKKVIYHGSFSHTFCPGIRISYLVLPDTLIELYKIKYNNSSSRISSLDQSLLSSFISLGYYNRHIGRLKKNLNIKKEIIKEILDKNNIEYTITELSFIISPNKDINEIKKHLKDASIKIHFVSDYSINNNDNRLILSYMQINIEDLENGLNSLINCL